MGRRDMPMIHIPMPEEMLQALDKHVEERGETRAMFARRVFARALKMKLPPVPKPGRPFNPPKDPAPGT